MLLRKAIPVRTEHWDVAGPGWNEADTAAHGGESMAGDFVWSLTMTDVHTQWGNASGLEQRPARRPDADRGGGKGAALRPPRLQERQRRGVPQLALADYFLGRKAPVAFTRPRPYRKNDNARVEQKNWTQVRQLIGYGRLAEPAQAGLLNALYA